MYVQVQGRCHHANDKITISDITNYVDSTCLEFKLLKLSEIKTFPISGVESITLIEFSFTLVHHEELLTSNPQ